MLRGERRGTGVEHPGRKNPRGDGENNSGGNQTCRAHEHRKANFALRTHIRKVD